MSTNSDNGEMPMSRPAVTPRSSSLKAHRREPSGKEALAVRNTDSDGESVNSENEKERVREKLKKTSIAGINAHILGSPRVEDTTENTENEKREDEPTEEAQEGDHEMGCNDNKSVSSDASSSGSRQSRKRSRDSDDDGDDVIEEDNNAQSRPRAHGRKRSRELSDDEAAKKESYRQEQEQKSQSPTSSDDTKDEDTKMLQSQSSTTHTPPLVLTPTISEHTSPPEVQMKEGDNDQSCAAHESKSPRRKGDGRKRIREEGDVDEEDVKIKKPTIEEAEDVKKAEEEGVSNTEKDKDSPDLLQDSKAEGENNASSIEGESSSATETKSEAKIPPGSGFANTSSKSPFVTATANAKPLFGAGATRNSLFANSKFGTMSGSTVSPFGQLGTSSPGTSSPFAALGGGSKPLGFGLSPFGSSAPKPASSPFGVLAAKSPDILSSVPKTAGVASGKPVKPFGAPDDTEDEGSGNEEGDGDDACDDTPKNLKSEFSQEKEHITGEENEICVCQYRAKLFYFDSPSKAWKERGIGMLKLLSSRVDLNDLAGYGIAPDAPARLKSKLRLVMRTEAVHKVILNVPLVSEALSTYGDEKGNAPSNNTFRLMGFENGNSQLFILKLKNNAEARALHGHILELLAGDI